MSLKVIKKDNTIEPWSGSKIEEAILKASDRTEISIEPDVLHNLATLVQTKAHIYTSTDDVDCISTSKIHNIVINTLCDSPYKKVGEAYKEYRNFKNSYAKSWEEVKEESERILYLGDNENANFDSSLISTKRSLIQGALTKELYKQFYLTPTEKTLIKRGDIYLHDLRDMLLNCINCLDGSMLVTIKQQGAIKTLTLEKLGKLICNNTEGIYNVLDLGIQILSRNGWVSLEGFNVRTRKTSEPLYHIKANKGLTLKATADHRIPVINSSGSEELKYVKDIVVGDSLITPCFSEFESNINLINLIDYVDPEDTFVGNIKYLKRYVEYVYDKSLNSLLKSLNCTFHKNLNSLSVFNFKKLIKEIEIPFEVLNKLTLRCKGASADVCPLLLVTPELAKVFGYLFADGCVSQSRHGCYQVTFSSTHQDRLEDFKQCLEKLFPTVHVIKREPEDTSTSPCWNITISNAVLWQFFNCFKRKANDITVPDFISSGSEEIVYAFLGAIWECDGSYSEGAATYTTASKHLAEQTTLLLQNLGYTPSYSVKNLNGTPYNVKGITGFRKCDLHIVKLDKSKEISKLVLETKSAKANKIFLKEKKLVNTSPYKIINITPITELEDYVYDLQTSDSYFIANGFVVHNCCLFDIGNVLKGGFTMSNINYSEPKSALSALQVIGDVTLVASAQQFGGFTVPEVDKILLPYCKKTLERSRERGLELGLSETKAEEFAWDELNKELRQGFQSLELKLNTVPSSRGDFAFTTLTFGQWDTLDPEDNKILYLICHTILETRKKGHGGKPVVFPKLIYLHDKNQIERDYYSEKAFDEAIECSSKCCYPDYLSLTGAPKYNKVAQEYLNTGKVISAMGCRAYLSHWSDPETGETITVGRCNIGAVSLHLPLILALVQEKYPTTWKEHFFDELKDRLEVIRNFFKRRYDVIRHTKASTNPLAFTQGGFYKGNLQPNQEIGDLVQYMTASFGITALNEFTILWNGKSIKEDPEPAIAVVQFIQDTIDKYKKEDGYLYALYGVPAENLCGVQARQYRDYTGDIRFGDFLTNSFHCHVSENISPIEKQNYEFLLFHMIAGGHINYVRIDNPENQKAIKSLVQRGMDLGFYQGVNFDSAYCENCGKHSTNVLYECPRCGSKNISVISRVCGYLGYSNINGISRMNDAKMAEIRQRKSM